MIIKKIHFIILFFLIAQQSISQKDQAYLYRYFVNNEELLINQKTNYPYDGRIEFTFGNKNPVKSKLNIRVPGWYRDSVIPGDLYEYKDKSRSSVELIINGINQIPNISNGYIILDKKEWSTNDKIEVNFKMRVKKVLTNKKVISNINKL